MPITDKGLTSHNIQRVTTNFLKKVNHLIKVNGHRRMDKEVVVHIYNGILLSHKKERN